MKVVTGDSVGIELAGAAITIPAQTVAALWLEKIQRESQPGVPGLAGTWWDPPKIGSDWMGGRYAGIARGVDGQADAHLIVLEEREAPVKWKEAVDWSLTLGEGSHLPTRREAALCFANVPELFQKDYYWTCEPYAGVESCAWYQYFDNGYQYGNGKDSELRARAVRRLTI